MKNTVNQKQLHDLLVKTIPNGLPVLTASSPGLGKSDIHRQAAKKVGYDCIVMHPATLDPVDFSGMPVPVKGDFGTRIERLLDEWLATVFDAKENTLLLLDELGQAQPAVQAACAPLLLDRRIGKYKLPEHVTICAATNSRQHRAGATNILTHLISRMACVLELECSIDAWLDWAVPAGVRSEVISFIRFRGKLLNDFDAEKAYSEMQAYPNPRSWNFMSRLLNADLPRDSEMQAFSGCVGPGASQEFMTHLTSVRELPDLDAMIDQPKLFKLPEKTKANLRWAVATGVALRINDENAGRVFQIIDKIHDQGGGEYAAVSFRDVLKVMPEVHAHPDFRKFAANSVVARTILRV